MNKATLPTLIYHTILEKFPELNQIDALFPFIRDFIQQDPRYQYNSSTYEGIEDYILSVDDYLYTMTQQYWFDECIDLLTENVMKQQSNID